MTKNDGAISTLLGLVGESLDTLEDHTNLNRDDIIKNTAKINTNTASITSNTGKVSTNTADIASDKGKISTNTADITSNSGKISTNTASIATNTNTVKTAGDNISEIQSFIQTTLKASITSLKNEINKLKAAAPVTVPKGGTSASDVALAKTVD